MAEKKEKFDPNNPSPKEVDFSPSQDQRRRYNAYVKKRFREEQNPDVLDIKDWVRMSK